MDALIAAIEACSNPTVAGLDTRLEYLPADMQAAFRPQNGWTLEAAEEALVCYNKQLVDALCDIVPAVKVQAAYYEMYGVPGMRAFERTIDYAKAKGMLVMADVKRNDIGATAQAYAAAYLSTTPWPDESPLMRPFAADFATVNPYLGVDGIEPFVKSCKAEGTGIFVLVKTSNPSSGDFQDLDIGGKPLYEIVGEKVLAWGKAAMGERGYSSVGAVVGATWPEQGAALREKLPGVFFLVPGYGAQGATAADLVGTFDKEGRGAIVNASRSILCAHQKRPGKTAQEAAREEALAMREALCTALRAAGKGQWA